MAVKVSKLTGQFVAMAIFFNFIGQKVALLFLGSVGLLSFSRYLSMPLRIFINLCLIAAVMLKFQMKSRFKKTWLFLWFIASMVIGILYSVQSGDMEYYYLTAVEVLLYFGSFCFLPFILITNLRLEERHYVLIFKTLMFSGLLFALLAIYFYQSYIGSVGRLTQRSVDSEDVLSPLILSYSSALAIGLGIAYWMENKIKSYSKLYLLIIIGLSLIPFFLGASRGSLMALFGSVLIVLFIRPNLKTKFKIIIGLPILLMLTLYFADLLGSSLFDRLQGIETEISTGSGGRISRYNQALTQFQSHPVFGGGIVLKGFNNYPHNIILEVLQAGGLFGIIPFLALLYLGFKKVRSIIVYNPSFSWLAVLFLQSFLQNLFSGSIINAAWFWVALALLFSFKAKNSLQYKEKI